MELRRSGILFCLCGPAGAGKTTVAASLISNHPPLSFSVSVTSRAPRSGEINGQSYHFVSENEFKEKIAANELFEHELVHGNYYGTLKSTVDQALVKGHDLLLDIDIKGAINFKKQLPKNTVIVFIAPPSIHVLKQRLMARGSVSPEDLARRMQTAESEFDTVKALLDDSIVDYLIVNEYLEDTIRKVSEVLLAERKRLYRLNSEDIIKLCSITTGS